MPQRGQPTSLQQRLEIVERAKAGANDRQIAVVMNLSIWTVRKWRRREQHQGRSGLSSCMGRPATGALGATSAPLREALRALRQAHPGWGPQTLRLELAQAPRFEGHRLPSCARIAAFLKQEGLTRRYEHHQDLVQPSPVSAQVAHEEWELDAQGVVEVKGLGRVVLIDLIDTLSRLKVETWPCVNCIKASTPDYQLACRRAFMRYGLPRRISLDHDSAFYDNTCASPFPARFHLWLIGLGIEVRFIHQPPPADHAVIERTHQIMTNQALAGQSFADQSQCVQVIETRQEFLNQTYPTRTFGGRPPLTAHPEAAHSGRFYDPYEEATCFDLQRLYAYLAQHRWFRQVSPQGQFSLGSYRYGLGQAWAKQTIEITFNPHTLELVCYSEDGRQTLHLPAQGLTKTDLLGELPPWQELPAFQRRLPFDPSAWRENILFQQLTGTTL